MNINSKEYWDVRFVSGSWEAKMGREQTAVFAKTNTSLINISSNFSGKLLDFGCGLGDAMPIYRRQYKHAELLGVDHSVTAINKCKEKYGHVATFINCNHFEIPKVDVIISCAVFEHLSNQMDIVRHLLTKCADLYIFVPYKEEIKPNNEHVNSYDENSFDQFEPNEITVYLTKGWSQYGKELWINVYLKNFIRPFFNKKIICRNRMIMFHLKGELENE